MPLQYRRPGVPTKTRKTEFVNQLVAEGYGVKSKPRVVPAQVEIDARNKQLQDISDAEDAKIRAMSEDEFLAILAGEGFEPNSFMADPHRALRK